MRRLTACAGLAAVALSSGTAAANGRFPATVNIEFHPTDPDFFLVPATFGLLVTKDGGDSFQWVCELAIGYTGTYDPDYVIGNNGDIYATTFEGLRVSRDQGCSWETLGPPLDDSAFVSQIERGPDGRIWAVTSTGGDNNMVYVSDDGASFVGVLGQSDFYPRPKVIDPTWWLSVATTPDDLNRVYVTGYYPDSPPRAILRRKSTADDRVWQDLPLDDINFGDANPFFYLVGVSPTDPDILFGRAVAAVAPIGDALYRSIDGGQNWTEVLRFQQTMNAFVIRSDGQTVIAGSPRPCEGEPASSEKGCVRISHDAGETWEATESQPQMQCVGERSDGMLFSCGYNFAPDFFAVGSSSDAETWETVFRFASFEDDPGQNAPLICPDGTPQAEMCAGTVWPQTACVDLQLDLPLCHRADAGPMVGDGDAGGDGGDGDSGGCCRASGAAPTGRALPALFLVLGLLWMRRRRR